MPQKAWPAISTVVVCLLLVASARAQEAEDTAPNALIARLVRQLGDADFATRDAAERRLIEIGAPALAALRKAMTHDDPEIAMRARRAFNTIAYPGPQTKESLRVAAKEAFRNADYKAMAAAYRRLSHALNATYDDRLWLGHAWQLAGEWRKTVQTYKAALTVVVRNPVVVRSKLALQIGRLERCELNDPAAAAKTLAEAVASLEADKLPINQTRLDILRELAFAGEQMNAPRAALEAWAKIDAACREAERAPAGAHVPVVQNVDIERVGRLFATLPPDEPLPAFPSIFVLTPDEPDVKLMPGDEATRKRSYAPAQSGTPHWRYAFAPPPGKEFSRLEISCDIEQIRRQHVGQLDCYAMTEGEHPARVKLGHVYWPGDGSVGRDVLKTAFEVPAGVRLVHVRTGSFKDIWTVHSVAVKATFRPVTKDPEPLWKRAETGIQTEALPKGGKLTMDGRTLIANAGHSGFEPGLHRFRYEVPGRKDVFETEVLLVPGRTYGLFVNLDSPFRWSPVDFGPMSRSSPARPGLVQLPDGSWLAVWCTMGDSIYRIMVSRSADFLTWSKPEAHPHNSVFSSIEPATFRDRDGTVWLAYFSKRLSLPDQSTGGYRLWLTSTRDGRTWTPIRPVAIDVVDGWPITGPQMLRTRDGKCWIFWRGYAGTADSFAEVHDLRKINVEKRKEMSLTLWNPHVTQDDKGVLHMVFDNFGRGIYHTTSRDGFNWKAPTPMVAREPQKSVSNPQLVLHGEEAVLFYWCDGARVVPVSFDAPPVKPLAGLKITNHVVPTGGGRLARGRLTLTKGDEVLLLAGADTAWLLRATLKDLMDVRPSAAANMPNTLRIPAEFAPENQPENSRKMSPESP